MRPLSHPFWPSVICAFILALNSALATVTPPSPATATDPYEDSDGDDLTNAEELLYGTNPNNPDTDGDGVPDALDGWPRETLLTLSPLPELRYALIKLSTLKTEWEGLVYPTFFNDKNTIVFQKDGATHLHLVSSNSLVTLPSTFTAYGLSEDDILYGWEYDTRPSNYYNTVSAIYSVQDGVQILPPPPASLVYIPADAFSEVNDAVIGGSSQSGWIRTWSGQWFEESDAHGRIFAWRNDQVLPPNGVLDCVNSTASGSYWWSGLDLSSDLPYFAGERYPSVDFDWLNIQSSPPFAAVVRDGIEYNLGSDHQIVDVIAVPDQPAVALWKHNPSGTLAWSLDETVSAVSVWDPAQQSLKPVNLLFDWGAQAHGNTRLEILAGEKLVRNGCIYDLSALVSPGDQITGININNHGVILGFTKETINAQGQSIPIAQQQPEPVLLVPVDLTISHPVVTSPEPPEYIVSADVASVLITAAVTGAADGTLIGWEIETGTGTLSVAESATVNGFAQTTLNTSTVAGDVYRVTARVKKLIYPALSATSDPLTMDFEAMGLAATDTSLRQTTADITVVPGFAAAITVARETSAGAPATTLAADGQSRMVLVATVRDAFGQPVAEHTPVTWHLSGLGALESADATVDAQGIARATLVAGEAVAAQKVRIEVDSFEIVETVANTAVTGSLTAASGSLDIASRQTTTLTASLPGVADGTPVRWFTSLGEIENPAATVQSGQAAALLRAGGGRTGTATITAALPGSLYTADVAFTTSAPITIEVDHPVIVGDQASDGTIDVPRLNGTSQAVSYPAATPVHIRAPAYPGYTATVRFGKMGPVSTRSYHFDQITSGTTPSATGASPATVSGATLDPARRQEGAASLFFDGEDAVLGIADDPALQLQPDLAVSLWVYAADADGSLVSKAGEYDLFINAEGRAAFTVITDTGPHTITGPPLPLERWIAVRAEYRADGTLRLATGGAVATATASGEPVPGSALVLVGENYGGWLDLLSIEVGESFTEGTGLTINGLNASNQVVLDANGEATLSLAGNNSGAISAEAPIFNVGVKVSINPQAQASDLVLVTTRENYAVLDATLGEVRVNTAGASGPLTPQQREELLARCLREMDRTGQRAAALPFPSTGTLAERQQYGFRATLWMEQTVGGAAQLRVVLENTEMLTLTPEEKQVFEDECNYLLLDAIKWGSDADAQVKLMERYGGLLHWLEAQTGLQTFPTLVQGVDGRSMFKDLGELHETHGPELVSDLVRLAQLEAIRNPGFLERIVTGLMRWKDTLPGDWLQETHASLDIWMREHTTQAIADGKISGEEGYYIGFGWGLANEAYNTQQMTTPFAGLRMAEQMVMTIAAAQGGSEEAKVALKSMIPIWGLTVMNDSTNQLVAEGRYFEAGEGSAQLSVATVGTVQGAVAMAKAGIVITKMVKQAAKAKKGGPPRLPAASFGNAPMEYWTGTTWRYADLFFDTYPHLKPYRHLIEVHHAVGQQVVLKGWATARQINSIQNLRGIWKSYHVDGTPLHRGLIKEMQANAISRFEKMPQPPSIQDLLHSADEIDNLYGADFVPKVRQINFHE